MNSRVLFAVAVLGLVNAVKITDDFSGFDFPPPGAPAMPEMGGDAAAETELEIDEAGAYWTGMNGAYTADDGTLFVDFAEEEDDATEDRNEDGKIAQ